MDWNTFMKGLQITGYGLGGVFSVLILFYIVTKIMLIISNIKTKSNG